jgi:hypothetical protein
MMHSNKRKREVSEIVPSCIDRPAGAAKTEFTEAKILGNYYRLR